jgi:hypothetical protein
LKKEERNMKTIFAALTLGALALAAPAGAQTPMIGVPWVPLGYCQLLSPATATKLSSCGGVWNSGNGGVPAGANLVVIRTETQAIRYRDDGTAPTAGNGQPIGTADIPFVYEGNLSALQIIQQGANATVDVTFYKIPAQ